jgi:hypothetical protein
MTDDWHGVEDWASTTAARATTHAQRRRANPGRRDCDCGTIIRILTPGQVRQKFAHLSNRYAKTRRS